MKIGLNVMGLEAYFGGNIRDVLDVVVRADRKGVDIVYVSDHVGFQRSAHESRRKTHGFPFVLEQPWYEPISYLSAMAVMTERIRLSTFIMVAPLRPALLLAKQLATLDVLSNGRVTIGLGVGWQEEEFRAAGMEFEGRFGDLEDQILAMRSLWGDTPASGKGRSFEFEDFHAYPMPVQGPNLPVLLGMAATPRNLDRMARLAQGWAVAPADGSQLAQKAPELRALFEKHGRDPAELEIHCGQLAARNSDGSVDLAGVKANAEKCAMEGATTVSFLATDFCRDASEIDAFLDLIVSLKS